MLLMATVWPMTMAMVTSVCANSTTQVHIHDVRSYEDRIGIYIYIYAYVHAKSHYCNILSGEHCEHYEVQDCKSCSLAPSPLAISGIAVSSFVAGLLISGVGCLVIGLCLKNQTRRSKCSLAVDVLTTYPQDFPFHSLTTNHL